MRYTEALSSRYMPIMGILTDGVKVESIGHCLKTLILKALQLVPIGKVNKIMGDC